MKETNFVVMLLQEMLVELKKLNFRAKGETWPANLTISNTAVLTIDFKESKATLNTPDPTFTQNILMPEASLVGLTVTNDGPFNIQYATNRALSTTEANATLKPSETAVLDFKGPSIVRLNIVAIGGPSNVRLVGLI